jgi:CRISPR-associated protein Csm1
MGGLGALNSIEMSLALWCTGSGAAGGKIPEWPSAGIAIEGDFSGIQRFVLRPVPGAGGAARRLRARSFRVLALTRLVAAAVERRFASSQAHLFYCAGGRFLVVAGATADWAEQIARLQCELDEELMREYRGELIFHLAAAPFSDGRIPVKQLSEAMRRRKLTPLGQALRRATGWTTEFSTPIDRAGKCEGCSATALLREETYDNDLEQLCQTCLDDRELGRHLLESGGAALTPSLRGPIKLFNERWAPAARGHINISLITHAPRSGNRLATFEELSRRAAGRQYLAYLRLDADRIGEQFRCLEGEAHRTWGLSALLDGLFSTGVDSLIGSRFPNLYPVYGGGDDLFLIGPWNEVLDFAQAFRSDFRALSGGRLTFSAGVALAKPRQHILTKSDEAERALDHEAKEERDSICALGATIRWSEFDEVYRAACQLAELHAAGKIRSALLHDLIELHGCYQHELHDCEERGCGRRGEAGDARWHSRLFYQIERNLSGDAKNFATREFLRPGKSWRHTGFIARYAMLRAGEGTAGA